VICIISARKADKVERKRYEAPPVKYQLDPHNPPALTAKQRAEVATLAAQTDKQIDKSAIPQMDDDF
jgi:hypothetical protein